MNQKRSHVILLVAIWLLLIEKSKEQDFDANDFFDAIQRNLGSTFKRAYRLINNQPYIDPKDDDVKRSLRELGGIIHSAIEDLDAPDDVKSRLDEAAAVAKNVNMVGRMGSRFSSDVANFLKEALLTMENGFHGAMDGFKQYEARLMPNALDMYASVRIAIGKLRESLVLGRRRSLSEVE